jgi:hypothetical protein
MAREKAGSAAVMQGQATKMEAPGKRNQRANFGGQYKARQCQKGK